MIPTKNIVPIYLNDIIIKSTNESECYSIPCKSNYIRIINLGKDTCFIYIGKNEHTASTKDLPIIRNDFVILRKEYDDDKIAIYGKTSTMVLIQPIELG